METIALQAVPKQQFTIVLDNLLYDLALKETNGCMSFDCTRGGVVIAQGQRIVAGTPLLPYDRMEAGQGNFAMLTQNGQLPYYTLFESTQTLVYATPEELAAINDKGPPPIRYATGKGTAIGIAIAVSIKNPHKGAGTAIGVAIASGVGAAH